MKYHIIFISTLLFLFSTASFAKSIHPQVMVISIHPTKTEVQKKEIYLSVSEFWPNGKSKTTCIPPPPRHWTTNSLKKPLNATAWKTKLPEGQAVKLKMTLVEQHNPPFDPNVILSIVSLDLKNNKGLLESEWSIDKGYDESLTINKAKEAKRFYIAGYTMDFAVK